MHKMRFIIISLSQESHEIIIKSRATLSGKQFQLTTYILEGSQIERNLSRKKNLLVFEKRLKIFFFKKHDLSLQNEPYKRQMQSIICCLQSNRFTKTNRNATYQTKIRHPIKSNKGTGMSMVLILMHKLKT